MTTDINTLLMGSGGRSAKFEDVGATVVGFVTHVEVRQRTKIGTGEPLTWPDGNPQQQLVITLETETREDDEDDGLRNLYVAIPSQMRTAIAEAVRRTGEKGIAVGGKLGVKFTKTEPPKQKGFSPQKIYVAKYEAPVQSVAVDDFDAPADDDTPF